VKKNFRLAIARNDPLPYTGDLIFTLGCAYLTKYDVGYCETESDIVRHTIFPLFSTVPLSVPEISMTQSGHISTAYNGHCVSK